MNPKLLNPELLPYAEHWLANLTFDLSRYAVFAISVWFVIWVVLRHVLRNRKLRQDTPPVRQLATEFLEHRAFNMTRTPWL